MRYTIDRELTSTLRKEVRKAWLQSKPGLDNGTILDILVYTEVRGLERDKSVAEVLEDVVFFDKKVPMKLEWYEGEYLRFVREWAEGRKNIAREVLRKLEERRGQA
jgi:hypothetical protein